MVFNPCLYMYLIWEKSLIKPDIKDNYQLQKQWTINLWTKCSASLDRSLRKKKIAFPRCHNLSQRSIVFIWLLNCWDIKPQSPHLHREKRFQSAFEIRDGRQLQVPIGLLVNKNKKIQFRAGTCIYYTWMTVGKNQLSLHTARRARVAWSVF